MSILKLFTKRESLLSLDIGATGIKLLEFDMTQAQPTLLNLGVAPLGADVFSGNSIAKVEHVAEQISGLLEANGISGKRVVTAVPAPSVITKRITMPHQSLGDLSSSIQFEAANFIPHNIDAVRLDFHILGETPHGQLDVLVVAVKNEVIESYLECLSLAGLEAAVVDVDYFAIQNMFETVLPEYREKTVALLNIGARYSTINVCCGGASLFTADVPVGGRTFTEGLMEEMGISEVEAENLKKDASAGLDTPAEVLELLDQKLDFVVTEIHRQLGFFWSASAGDESIERIFVSGGGALVPGILEEIREKTGTEAERIDTFRGINRASALDAQLVQELAPVMGVCVGLGMRSAGDRDLSAFEG